ncbi:MAG: NUDIX hydrolase [Isosphaeraceae bacterium]
MIGNLGKLAKKLPYHGSGLLFASNGSGSWRVLLFQRAIRPRRGVWSIVGGRCKPGETYIQAAVRGASEEICGRLPMLERFHGVLPEGFVIEQAKEHIQYGIPFVFGWRTSLIELTREIPTDHLELNWENHAARWFGVRELPRETHFGVLCSLRHFGLSQRNGGIP